eukprot:1743213-Rhodomonas_salina.1
MSTISNSNFDEVATAFSKELTVPEQLNALHNAVPLDDEFDKIWGPIINHENTTGPVFKFQPTDPAAHFDANAFISNMAAIALREKVGKQLKAARTELAALMVQTTILSPTTRRRHPTPRMQDYQSTLEDRRTRRTRFLVAHVGNLERQLQAVEAILY